VVRDERRAPGVTHMHYDVQKVTDPAKRGI
jgi:hypothetical protein